MLCVLQIKLIHISSDTDKDLYMYLYNLKIFVSDK